MKNIILIFLFITSVLSSEVLDINNASIDQIYDLPIDSSLSLNLYHYIKDYDGLKSFTDLYKVPGMDDYNYQKLLPLVHIVADIQDDWKTVRIDNLRDRLASEDNPGTGAIGLWEDLLLYPYDLNEVSVEELDGLWRVSLIDAASVIRHKYTWEDYRYIGELRNVENLSSYGYRNMRDYLKEPDEHIKDNFFGIARLKIALEHPVEDKESTIRYYIYELNDRINELADTSSSLYERLITAGWSQDSINNLIDNLNHYQKKLTSPGNNYNNQNFTVKGGYGNNYRAGITYYNGSVTEEQLRGYFTFKNIGPIDIMTVGDYRITIGEGLFLDNTYEFRARQTEKVRGIFGDLTENQQYGFRGAVLQMKLFDIAYPMFFISYTKRQAIMANADTAIVLFYTPWDIGDDDNYVNEKTFGGGLSFRFDKMFPGAAVELYAYQTIYDHYFSPDTNYIDIPNDKDNLSDGNFLYQLTGKERTIYSISSRGVIFGNLGISAEAAVQNEDKYAYIINSRLQYEFLYIDFIWRHYDVGFDNPFSRAFAEQSRFDDTELEKPYRLINPLYSYLQEDPVPKAEEGLYVGTRYQINRQLTISRAYIDIWKNLSTGLDNYRAEARIDYRVVYPFNIRLRQKWQTKHLTKTSYFSTSITNETELQFRFLLGNGDVISTSFTRSQVQLSQRTGSGSEIISGYFLSGRYEHEFHPGFSILGGMDAWNGEEMSQWEFEDMGIDFLYGYGIKSYFVLKERMSDNVFLRFKIRYTNYYHPYYGSEEIYDNNSQQMYISGFRDINNNIDLSLLIDYRL